MKTLKNKTTNEIKRVDDKTANQMVSQTFLGWEYCPKSLWKEIRPSKGKQVEVGEDNRPTESNISEKKVRKMRREEKSKRHASKR